MRRLVALFVVALVGAALYGLSGSSSGVSVNHDTVSGYTLDTELAAISHNNSLQCFLTALDPNNFAPGAGGFSIKAAGAAAWANLRVEGLAIDQYVTATYHYHPSAAELASAKTSLVNELQAAEVQTQSTSNPLKCPGTSADAVAEMPSEMRTAEIESQATSQYLVNKIKAAIPLTATAMKQYYNQHVSDYDTLCVSIALVEPSDVTAFVNAESAPGASVAQLAKTYSKDPSSTKGGTYGCYAPSNASYAGVRADVGTEGLNTFSATPQYIDYNNAEYGLFVAVTKRTVTPYAKASTAVLSDLQGLNAEAASTQKNQLLEEAAVYVDPAFGQWGASTTGLGVLAGSSPAKSGVLGASSLAGAATTSYK
ncbi:MAG TPA: hypothetical protein VGG17_08390 [Acidimicrobiales bacterium]